MTASWTYKKRVMKIGNSSFVLIPAEHAQRFGQVVSVECRDKEIIIKKLKGA